MLQMSTSVAVPPDISAELVLRTRRQARIQDAATQILRACEENDSEGADGPGRSGALRTSCFAGLLSCFMRKYDAVKVEQGTPINAPISASNSITRHLLGRARATPTSTKLENASLLIEGRVTDLTERIRSIKAVALTHHQSGNKAEALRQMRRAKQAEGQLTALRNSSLAIERHADLVAEAGLQREIASALSEGSKTMKQSRGLLSKVERAVDDVQDAHDDGEDIQGLLQQLADSASHSSAYDDDELMREIEDELSTAAVSAKQPVATDVVAREDAPSQAMGSFPAPPTELPHASLANEATSSATCSASGA